MSRAALALICRLRSGTGQRVPVAIHEAVAKNTEMDLMSWVMLRQPVYRQTCRHALAMITNPSISYTKDGRWNLSTHVGSRDQRHLRPFLERYGLADGMTEVAGEPVPGVRAVAGSSAAATAGVEYVQRLTRRFRHENLPWREAQRSGLLWSPIRKPHENALDEHRLSRGTFADVDHPELNRSPRYPVSKWISTRGSWRAGRRAPLLGEDDKLFSGGWEPDEERAVASRPAVSALPAAIAGAARRLGVFVPRLVRRVLDGAVRPDRAVPPRPDRRGAVDRRLPDRGRHHARPGAGAGLG